MAKKIMGKVRKLMRKKIKRSSSTARLVQHDIEYQLKTDLLLPQNKVVAVGMTQRVAEIKPESAHRSLLTKRGFVFTQSEMEQRKKNAMQIMESIHIQ